MSTSRQYTALARNDGLRQEFITPHSPQQNGMIERDIRAPKEQCVHRHRFESLRYASRVIEDWIHFYDRRRPHQVLYMKTPAEAYALAISGKQVLLDRCTRAQYQALKPWRKPSHQRVDRHWFCWVITEMNRAGLDVMCFQQDDRLMQVQTVLGPEPFVVKRFEGVDSVLALFLYQAEWMSANTRLELKPSSRATDTLQLQSLHDLTFRRRHCSQYSGESRFVFFAAYSYK